MSDSHEQAIEVAAGPIRALLYHLIVQGHCHDDPVKMACDVRDAVRESCAAYLAARGPADPRQRRVEHELEETCNCEFPNECLFEAGFKAAGDHLQYRLIACEPRGECPVCGGETDHVDSCLVGILERRLAARGSSTPEQPAGQSTALVEVKAEEDLGLVRVQLSLDAPSYLLPASQARNLGELLIEAVERIKHDD